MPNHTPAPLPRAEQRNLTRIVDVALTWRRRVDRDEHPEGRFDNAGRFYLSEACGKHCDVVRAPSRAIPYPKMQHGRTLTHVASRAGLTEEETFLAGQVGRFIGRWEEGTVEQRAHAVRRVGLVAAKGVVKAGVPVARMLPCVRTKEVAA